MIEKLATDADGLKIFTEKDLTAATGFIKDEATRERLSLEQDRLGLDK